MTRKDFIVLGACIISLPGCRPASPSRSKSNARRIQLLPVTHVRPRHFFIVYDISASYAAHLDEAKHLSHWHLIPLAQRGDALTIATIQPRGDNDIGDKRAQVFAIPARVGGNRTKLRKAIARAHAALERMHPLPPTEQGSDPLGVLINLSRCVDETRQPVILVFSDCEPDLAPLRKEVPAFPGNPIVYFLNVPHHDTATLERRKQHALGFCRTLKISEDSARAWDFTETAQRFGQIARDLGRTPAAALRPGCAECDAHWGRG